MTPRVVRSVGIAATVAYGGLVVQLYATRPRTFAEAQGGLISAVGLYHVDAQQFEAGRALFRIDKFPEARAAFGIADPAQRDPTTQFYIAYTFYRQGWGRFHNDDVLFRQGLQALDRAVAH